MAGLDVQIGPVAGDAAARRAELTGVIDGGTVAKIDGELGGLAAQGVQKLMVVMGKVRYVNDDGLDALERLTETFQQAGGGVALVGVGTRIKLMIDMMGKAGTLLMCGDEAEAAGKLAEMVAPAAAPVAEPSAGAPGPPVPLASSAASPAPVMTTPSAAGSGGLYPAAVPCGSCGLEIELYGPGNWKCPRCGVLLAARGDGTVSFSLPEEAPPLELVMHGAPEAVEALKLFVATAAEPALGGGEAVATLTSAVGEVVRCIVENAYGGDTSKTWQVAVQARPQEVQVKVADHGQTFESSRVTGYFPTASSTMSEFECRPHPKGGNVVRMVLRA